MNKLSNEKRAKILHLLVEGNTIRGTARLAEVCTDTILKLLADIGEACIKFHNSFCHDIKSKFIQCDEMWSFCGAKNKNTPKPLQKILGRGNAWLWLAMDTNSRFIVSWLVGLRTQKYANELMKDLSVRLSSRAQITTDGYKSYVDAVKKAFGDNINYGMLVKIYTNSGRYIEAQKRKITGNPDKKYISTSYVERLNLTLRSGNSRLARKGMGYSKKIQNHIYAIALYCVYYNFVRIHKTLRVTPAMETGISQKLWTFEDLLMLIPKPILKPRKSYKKHIEKL